MNCPATSIPARTYLNKAFVEHAVAVASVTRSQQRLLQLTLLVSPTPAEYWIMSKSQRRTECVIVSDMDIKITDIRLPFL